MVKQIPRVIVMTGYGINCDEETKFAFEKVGARADIVHINDLIAQPRTLDIYQILTFPGGFSHGDDTGSGYAYANKMRNHLWGEVLKFVHKDKLAIGICNGFQIMVNLGLLPAVDDKLRERQAALTHNDSAIYLDRWVDLEFQGKSVWTRGIGRMMLPIAHGEGKFYAEPAMMEQIKKQNLIAAKYVLGEICEYQSLPLNPNGSLDDIAGVTDPTGRLFGMMPHPERAISFTQLPHWTFLREKLRRQGKEMPEEYDGIKIFRNGVKYFE